MQLVAQTQYIHATREHRVQVEVKGDPVDYGTGEHAEFLKLGTLEPEEPVVFDRGFSVRSQGNSDLLVAEILSPAPVNEDDLPDALEVDEGAENEVSEALEARRVEQVAEPPLEHTEAAERADEQREEGRQASADEDDQTQARSLALGLRRPTRSSRRPRRPRPPRRPHRRPPKLSPPRHPRRSDLRGAALRLL